MVGAALAKWSDGETLFSSSMRGKTIYWLWLTIALAGGIAVWLLRPGIDNFPYANGKPLLAFYLPLPLALLFVAPIAWRRKLQKRYALLALLLFCVLFAPLSPLLLKSYEHRPQDDAFRYRVAATNIAHQNTLWGSDDVVFHTNRKIYMTQPGYRYYLAMWIKIAGGEMRMFQLINMFVYLVAATLFLIQLSRASIDEIFRRGLILFLLVSSLFATKLIMMGLMEWLVAAMMMLFACCYLTKKTTLSVAILALIPFMRQNLLVAVLCLFAWVIVQRKRYVLNAIIFFLILLLPLYHNLYYAGRWIFVSTYYNQQGYLVLESGSTFFIQLAHTFIYHVLLYGGIDWRLPNAAANLLAVTFVPLGTALSIYGLTRLRMPRKMYYGAISLAAIVPTLVLGGRAYYPRFEWINLMWVMITFVVISSGSRKIDVV